MHYTKNDISQLDKIERLNIINSISGIKPANLVGTISDSGQTNLTIISSVVHLGSNPALLGFIMRPTGEVPRHTYENIMQNGSYTINHIHESFYINAHYTSAKFDQSISEFDACHIAEEHLAGFKAPFVKQSMIKMGMNFLEEIPIKVNRTVMIIGEISHLIIDDQAFNDDQQIDLSKTNHVGISGLDSYYKLEKLDTLPYARVKALPNLS